MPPVVDASMMHFLNRLQQNKTNIADSVEKERGAEEAKLRSRLEAELALVQSIGVNKGSQVSYGIDTGLDKGYAIWLNQSESTLLFCLPARDYPLLVGDNKLTETVKKYFAEKGVKAENPL